MATNNRAHLIRKYPNRRLYSMIESAYVTHKDIVRILRSGPIEVVCSRTGRDITRDTLLLVLVRLETDSPSLSAEQLANMIRGPGPVSPADAPLSPNST